MYTCMHSYFFVVEISSAYSSSCGVLCLLVFFCVCPFCCSFTIDRAKINFIHEHIAFLPYHSVNANSTARLAISFFSRLKLGTVPELGEENDEKETSSSFFDP